MPGSKGKSKGSKGLFSPISTTMGTRLDEKKQLHTLNSRLSLYVMRVKEAERREKEAHLAREKAEANLETQVQTLTASWGRRLHDANAAYENENHERTQVGKSICD